jgi:hypothetical protein
MKVLSLVIIAVFIFLSSIAASKAQGVNLYLPINELTVNVGEVKSINLTIKNLQDKDDIFSLSIWPPFSPKFGIYANVQPRVELESKKETTIPVSFSVPECTIEGNLLFEIIATSLTNTSIRDVKLITLKVKGEGSTCLTEVKTNKLIFNPGEDVLIEVSVSNFAEDGIFTIETTVRKGEKIEKNFVEKVQLRSRESKTANYSFSLDKHALAGSYKVDVLLKRGDKVISSKYTEFEVKAIENLDYSYTSKNFLIFQTSSIKIKNLGNTLSKPTTQSLVIPWFIKIFFYSPTKLLEEKSTNGQVIYIWEIPSLNPLEEYEIKYEFRLWPIWFGVSLVIGFILFAYLRIYSIQVVKKIKPTGILKMGKEIPISISIVNNSSNELKDVIVKDLIPPIATVSEKFETLKPVKRKIKAGTELNWRISSLKPGEEVILTYRIIPIVDIVGSLKLPQAKVSFVSKGEKKRIVTSKPIVIAST